MIPVAEPSANLTAPCEKLTPLPEGATYGDLLEVAVEAAGKYREACRKIDGLNQF